ncbi:MAG: HAD hydrolase-like protein, partial [Deltaproteobacteria bacterium]|nr:HAD hydrolase-like protein [Deltaproteobacteria bacterium]
MDKELLVFDLDGTLIDSSSDIAWAANRTLDALGYRELSAGFIRENIGWGVRQLLERLMPDEPPDRITKARESFLEFYGTHLVVDTYVYPGVRETLGYFRGLKKKMAVVTNKPEGLARRILDEAA